MRFFDRECMKAIGLFGGARLRAGPPPQAAQRFLLRMALSAGLLGMALGAQAQEAVIRKNMAERFPEWPKVDEVTKTPMPGIYEVRIGNNLFYADEQASFVIEDGHMVDTKTRVSLTQQRLSKLTAISFDALPLKDAMVWRQGKGSRKVAVFADPNCPACRMFEEQLQQVKDVTVYVFLLPILGPDSNVKSQQIWCAKDNDQVWLKWMLKGAPPARFMGACDSSALQRNRDFSERYRITGTPAVIFEDGFRVPGAMNAAQLEKQLLASAQAGKR
jgi:thiol:disulfide interchange protein DsbC